MKTRRPSSTRAFFLSAALLLGLGVHGADRAVRRPLPRLDADASAAAFAADGLKDWRSAAAAALWASTVPALPGGQGLSADGTAAYMKRIEAAVSELRAQASGLDERARAEAVLTYMHKKMLSGYSDRQTRLDVLLQNGRFNCVSSAALYLVLAESLGLEAGAVATKDHAFCTVRLGASSVDVETTNPYGFDPGNKKEFHDSFGKVTGFAYVPERSYRDRNALDAPGLVSLILANRVSETDLAGRYAESVGPGVDRWTLLGAPSAGAAKDEMTVRLTNYGASLLKAGAEEDAIDWALLCVSRYGPDPRWSDFIDSAGNNLIVADLGRGGLEDARADLARLAGLLSPRVRRELEGLTADAELVRAAEKGDPGILAPLAAAARGSGSVPEKRIREIEVYVRIKSLDALSRASGWAAALAGADKAVAELGPDPKLVQAQRAFRANRVAELHNAFAQAFNAKRYAEARSLAVAAQAEFPDEARFKKFQASAEEALGSAGR